jgi:hypothetical protein
MALQIGTAQAVGPSSKARASWTFVSRSAPHQGTLGSDLPFSADSPQLRRRYCRYAKERCGSGFKCPCWNCPEQISGEISYEPLFTKRKQPLDAGKKHRDAGTLSAEFSRFAIYVETDDVTSTADRRGARSDNGFVKRLQGAKKTSATGSGHVSASPWPDPSYFFRGSLGTRRGCMKHSGLDESFAVVDLVVAKGFSRQPRELGRKSRCDTRCRC